jgi:photosystem II stability/assembly factor-like uncharacterized protein
MRYFLLILIFLKVQSSIAQWSARSLPVNNVFDHVQYASEDVIYASGIPGIYKSTDSGNSWHSVAKVFTNYDPARFYLFDTFRENIFFIDQNVGFYFGNCTNQTAEVIFRTANGGNTWTLVHDAPGGAIEELQFTSATNGYAIGRFGRILKTTNAGVSWTSLSSPVSETLNDLYFFDDNTGIIVGNNVILRTTNGGSSWGKTNADRSLRSISFLNAQKGIAAASDKLFMSEDGGVTWAPYAPNVQQYTVFTGIRFINGQFGLLSTTQGLYKTVDGDFWSPQYSAGSIDAYHFDFFNAQLGFMIGREGNLYKALGTSAGGDPMPENEVEVLAIQKHDADQCRGNYSVSARLINRGIQPLTTTTLNWSVDGNVQTPYQWNGDLLPGDTSDFITAGVFNFNKTAHDFNVQVWSSEPNGETDDHQENDLASSVFRFNKFTGTYFIGQAGSDFTTITSALVALSNAGLCDDVVFSVNNGHYTEDFHILNIPGIGIERTFTLQSTSGNPEDVVITLTGLTARVSEKHITIRDLTLKSQYSVLEVFGQIDSLMVEHNIIETAVYYNDHSPVTVGEFSGPITFRNNRFIGGIHGVRHYVYYGWQSPAVDADFMLENNAFLNQQTTGLEVSGTKARFVITGNRFISSPQGNGYTALSFQFIEKPQRIINNYFQFLNCGPNTVVTGASFWQSKSPINFSNNTMRFKTQTSMTAVSLNETDSVSVYNNILENQGKGQLFRLLHNTFLTCDYNDLFTADYVGSAGSDLGERIARDVEEWRAITGTDLHSINVDPQFNDEAPHISPATSNYALNGAGLPRQDVTTDIDGELRNSDTPDIGADEFESLAIDVGIQSVSPEKQICAATNQVNVVIKNFGTSAITGYTAHWQVDDVDQPQVIISDGLSAGSSENVILGAHDFAAGKHKIEVWLTGVAGDLVPRNDTISTHVTVGGLSGSFTIGGSSPDFAGFGDALNALKNNGICGSVIFNVRSGIYTQRLEVNKYNGVSEQNTITFQSEAMDSTAVTVAYAGLPLILDGAEWIIFQHLHFQTTSGGTIIELKNKASHNVLRSNLLNGTFPDYGIFSSFNGNEEYNVIESNNFNFTPVSFPEAIAIKLLGSNASFWPYYSSNERGNVIRNNVITGVSKAIDIQRQSNFDCSGNDVSAKIGMEASLLLNQYNISGNTLRTQLHSVFISNSRNNGSLKGTIANNFIISQASTGIVLSSCDNVDIIHNTIKGSGNSVLTVNALEDSSPLLPLDSINVLNNILIGKGDAYCLVYQRSPGINSDYNIFWAESKSQFVRHYGNSFSNEYPYNISYDDLYRWQIGTQQDAHSRTLMPRFVSSTDLHIDNDARIDGKGIASLIATDNDRDPRNVTSPDPGADEFTSLVFSNDAGIETVLRPPDCGEEHDVKVKLKNYGSTVLSSATIYCMVAGGLMTPYEWTGSLSPGEVSDEVNLGGAYFLPSDTFNITAWTALPNGAPDQENLNDTLRLGGVYQRLSGTYYVGYDEAGILGNFENVQHATNYLNKIGVCGPVTLNIYDGTYSGRFMLKEVDGASETNRIIIQSYSQDSTKVILDDPYGWSTFASGIVHLNGTKYLTLNRVTIKANDDLDALLMENGASFNELRNNRFLSGDPFSSDKLLVLQTGGTLVSNAIAQNLFDKGLFAIWTAETSTYENTTISGNHFLDQSTSAIALSGMHKNTVVDNNVISRLTAGYFYDARGISIDHCRSGLVVANNLIRGNFSSCLSLTDNGTREHGGLVYNNMISGEDADIGIFSMYNKNLSFYFNTVNLTGTGYNSYYAFNTNYDSAINIVNNNFINHGDGVPMVIEGIFYIENSTIDYNNLWSRNGMFSWDENQFQSLEEYKSVSGIDEHSISIDPIFISTSNLHALNPALNGSGTPLPGLDVDIDGDARDAIPDIGADEIETYPADAGVSDVIVTRACLGDNDVYAVVQNLGSGYLAAATIEWTLNGSPQPPSTWTGLLLTGETSEPFKIGTANFDGLSSFEIAARTTLPNDLADPNSDNDGFTRNNIKPSAQGTFTIGGTSPDFATISNAVDMLEESGVCGTVKFLIRPGTYNEQIRLDPVEGTSAANRIIFQSETGDRSSVMVSYASTNGSFNYVWMMVDASYVTLQDLTIKAAGDTHSVGLKLNGTFNQTRIVNNHFISSENPSLDDANRTCIDGFGAAFRASTWKGNLIEGGKTGIIFSGAYNDRYATIPQDTITENHFKNQISTGAYGFWSNNFLITRNQFTSDNATFYTGMVVREIKNLSIVNNKFYTYGSGIRIEDCNNCLIGNNFISLRDAATLYESLGIVLFRTENSNVLNNSVHVRETATNSIALKLETLTFPGSKCATIKNNILYNSGGGLAMEVLYMPTTSTTFVSDNNDLFTTGNALVHWNLSVSNKYPTLLQWRAASSQDQQSISADPEFISNEDLHAQSLKLVGAGTPVSMLPNDIDNDVRHLFYPTIGADEFGTPRFRDVTIVGIESDPSLKCNAQQVFKIRFRNNGVGSVSSVTFARSLNGAAPQTSTWTGGLAPGMETLFTLQAETYSYNQLQELEITATHVNGLTDDNDNDNSFEKSFIIYEPAHLGDDVTLCDYEHSDFTISAQEGYSSYAWSIGSTAREITVYETSTYEVTVTDLNGCVSSDDLIVTFEDLQSTIQTDHAVICMPGAVELTAIGTGAAIISYQWFKSSEPISGETEFDLEITEGGAYAAKVFSEHCEAESEIVTISESAPPAKPQVSLSDDAVICLNETVTLSISDQDLQQNYQWTKDGVDVPGEDSFTLEADDAGRYAIVVSNEDCSISSDVVVITSEDPKGSISEEDGISICSGEAIDLHAQPSDTEHISISWFVNGEVIPGETSSSLHVTSGGDYEVEFKSAHCASNSETITVVEKEAPGKPVLSQNQEVQVCEGNSTTLDVEGVNDRYLWSNGETTSAISVSVTGQYYATVWNGTCQSEPSAKTSIIVNELPVAKLEVNDEGILTVSEADGYQWFRDEQLITGAEDQTYKPLASGLYYAVTQINGCYGTSDTFNFIITDADTEFAGIQTYPNPIVRYLSIDVPLQFAETVKARIFNSLGVNLKPQSIRATSSGLVIDLEGFACGIYYLEIEIGSSTVTRKVVVE